MGKFTAPDVKLPVWTDKQVVAAASSLKRHVQSAASSSHDLLADAEDEIFYLQLALKKMPLQARKDKPVPLPLPHPLLSPEGAEICLFVKDHQGEGHKQAKALVNKYERKGGVSKVVGLSKLRTKFESHEAKRELCKLYDLFLADERILPSLPKLIGKSFFKKKKQPIPIDITVKDFPAQVKKACAATYMFKNSGTCINIRAARSGQSEQQIADNIHAILCQAVEHIPKKWSNIQGVFLKTSSSVALPLYQALPDRQVRIDTSKPAPAITAPSTPAIEAPPAALKQAAGSTPASKKRASAASSREGGPSGKKAKS